MIILFLAPLFASLFLTGFMLDPDLGWHLRLGQQIVETRQAVTQFIGYNYYSSAIRPDHEWLSNIIFYEINKHLGGYLGLNILFGLLLLLSFYLVYVLAAKYLKAKRTIFFAMTFSLLPLAFIYGVRVQFLLPLGALLLLIIKNFVPSIKKRALFYFLTTLLFNNLHGGFVTLLPIVFLLELDIFQNKEPLKKRFYKYALIGISALLPVFINPYGLDYFKLIFDYSNNYYTEHITEWFPINSFPIAVKLLCAFLPLSIIIFSLLVNKYYRRLKYYDWLLLLLYGYLGIKHTRQFPVFALISLPYLSGSLLIVSKELKTKAASFLAVFACLLLILSLTTYELVWPQAINLKNTGFKDKSLLPENAAEFIEKNRPQEGNFLNPYNWGGYLSWKFQDLALFIDGRGPEKKVEGKTTILEIYMRFFSKDQKEIKENLDKHSIYYVLVQKPQPFPALEKKLWQILSGNTINDPKNNLYNYLKNNPDWNCAYDDPISAVYFKNGS